MYRLLFSLVFARMDPERAHHLAFRVIRSLPILGIGLWALMQRINRPFPLNISDLVFGIGPLINAAGRLGDAREAVRLLLSADKNSALDNAGKLVLRNKERREVDYAMADEAKRRFTENPGWETRRSIVLFNPDWHKGIVSVEPPEVGKPFPARVPAVDADGNVRSGIRLPDIAVPLATQAGWNYRDASIGSADRLAGEIGSYIPFPRTKAEREKANDPRLSIEERYRNRDEYVGKFAASALDLVAHGYLLPEDVAALLKHAVEHYEWATTARH